METSTELFLRVNDPTNASETINPYACLNEIGWFFTNIPNDLYNISPKNNLIYFARRYIVTDQLDPQKYCDSCMRLCNCE